MKGYLLIVLAAMLWGTTGTSQALAPDEFTPLTLGALRILTGGPVLLLIALYRHSFRSDTPWSLPVLMLAGIAIAIYQPTFFEGTQRTGVAVGTMVALGCAPVFAGIVEWLLHRTLPSRIWFIAACQAVAGCIALTGGGELQIDLTGVLFSLAAGLSYVIYAAAVRNLTQKHPPEAVIAVVFCVGALLLSPVILFADLTPLLTASGAIVVVHLGVLATGLSYTFFGFGMRLVPVSTAILLSLAEPLTAATLGILLLHEPVTTPEIIGMVLILSGMLTLTIGQRLNIP